MASRATRPRPRPPPTCACSSSSPHPLAFAPAARPPVGRRPIAPSDRPAVSCTAAGRLGRPSAAAPPAGRARDAPAARLCPRRRRLPPAARPAPGSLQPASTLDGGASCSSPPPAGQDLELADSIGDLVIWFLGEFCNFGHLVMDGGADEAVVGGGDIAGDEIGSNSSATTRQTASIPVRKKRYMKLGIAKSVLH